MDPLGAAIAASGAIVILVGLGDAFLTILHPDRDGRISAALNRGLWHAAVALARAMPSQRRVILGIAGPAMVVSDIVLWMAMPIVGYALLAWPFLTGSFASEVGVGFADALYFSGVTFTTLGFGDITPLSGTWELLAVVEAVTGFLVMSTSIAYIVAVFEGVDHRDALALETYTETGGTWSGHQFIARTLEFEGPDILRKRIEDWARLVRELHGRLYRFHGLALYLRTAGLDLGPERMVYTVSDVVLRAKILVASPSMRRLRPASDNLALGMEHFARAIVRRHGSLAARRAIEDPVPSPEDAQRVRLILSDLEAIGVELPPGDLSADPELLALTARLRVFLAEIDRLTRWRTLGPPAKDAG